MNIRLLNKDELNDCLIVIRESFLTVAKDFNMTEENCKGNSAYLKKDKLLKMYNSGIEIYGLFSDSLIACIALEKKSDVRYKIKLLSVKTDFRHKGYGKLLVDEVEKQVIAKQGKKIQLGCINENQRLVSWYESLGFRIDKTKKYKGNSFTVSYMIKDL